jgi:hypothetical protein
VELIRQEKKKVWYNEIFDEDINLLLSSVALEIYKIHNGCITLWSHSDCSALAHKTSTNAKCSTYNVIFIASVLYEIFSFYCLSFHPFKGMNIMLH